MTTKDRRSKFSLEDTDPDFTHPRAREVRRIRKVHPLGLRVVVQILKDANVTDTGLYLPEGAKESMQESVLAEVIEVASAIDTHTEEETNVSGIPLKSTVLIPKTAGVRVPWDDSLRIVDTRDVLAMVDEISVT
jgi:co-chaperonin GroES (HSP10)